MKKIVFSFLLLGFVMGIAFGQKQYTDKNKEFTFIIPENWELISASNLKYNMVIGECINDFTQTIVINSEKFDGDIEEYTSLSFDKASKIFPNIIVLKSEKFETPNIEAFKIVLKNELENMILRQYCYIFQKEKTFYSFTASVLDEAPEEIEQVFDASFKSLKFFNY